MRILHSNSYANAHEDGKLDTAFLPTLVVFAMWSTAREIADGDLVNVWMVSLLPIAGKPPLKSCALVKTRDLVQPLVISAGKELNNRFGFYRHSDLIGIPYGSKVGSRNGKGFIHVLRPTPELWTLALPHRTQILYLADIAFVTSWLDIKPGSKVIEAGALQIAMLELRQSSVHYRRTVATPPMAQWTSNLF